MQIVIKAEISKGHFPDTMHKSEITEYIKEQMSEELCSHISSRILKGIVCDHNIAGVEMKSIFIEDANGFFEKVNTLLDAPGLSKKEFREKLVKLINGN